MYNFKTNNIMKTTIEVNLNGLLQVVNQTGNPELALQVLYGTYTEPAISQEAVIKDKLYKFVSYNHWDKIVNVKTAEFRYYNEARTDFKYKSDEEYNIAEFSRFIMNGYNIHEWEQYAENSKAYALAE
jgi:hypothetical protein